MKGFMRQRGSSWEFRVFLGHDPLTGKQRYATRTVRGGRRDAQRELSVLRYLPSQLSQREIAGELYVSLNPDKPHCTAMYRTLGVEGRTPAVPAARDHGLL